MNQVDANEEVELSHKERERGLSTFTYVARCTECDWVAEWRDSASWRKGAPREHADGNGHEVITTATEIRTILPRRLGTLDRNKTPLSSDKWIAHCKQCDCYVGVGAGGFFGAAWKSHVKKTHHDVTVSANKKYRKET